MAANGDSVPRCVMWSIAQIATRDEVSKPTVSIRVKRFVDQHGLTVERDKAGRVVSVNVAQYDHLRDRSGQMSKAQAILARRAEAAAVAVESYDEALRQRTWLETEMRRVTLDQIKGRLVERTYVDEGYDRAGLSITDAIGRLDEYADDLAGAVATGGVLGVRAALKDIGRAISNEISAALEWEARRLRAAIARTDLSG